MSTSIVVHVRDTRVSLKVALSMIVIDDVGSKDLHKELFISLSNPFQTFP